MPGYIFLGWSGLWDSLPTAHFTTILWDLLAIIGLWFVGVRFGGPRLGAVFSFAWVAWPFTQYSSSSNTNDLIAPALLVWGFYFLTSPVKRGLFAAFSAWTKFASLVVVPLWSAYPDARAWRPRSRFVWGFLGGTALSFAILLLDPSPVHAVRVFYDHTFAYQFGRASPFSLWDWRQYHAKGLPNLRWVQRVLFGTLVAGLDRARLVAAAPEPAAHGRVHGRAARRLRVGADALVVALPAVVLPVRRDRSSDAAPRRAGADRRPPARRAGADRPADVVGAAAAGREVRRRERGVPLLLGPDRPRLLLEAEHHRRRAVPDLRIGYPGRRGAVSRLLARVSARRAAGVRRPDGQPASTTGATSAG